MEENWVLELNELTGWQLVETEWGLVGAGVIGLLLALYYIVFGRPRRKRSEKESLLVDSEASTTPDGEAFRGRTVTQPQKAAWWTALSKTREKFFGLNSKEVSDLKEALEEACLVSDLGVGNTSEALEAVDWSEVSKLPEEQRLEAARSRLAQVIRPWLFDSNSTPTATDDSSWLEDIEAQPKVIWFVGVNGVGKTTSIAKMAAELKGRGHSVLLAAGDTFRAAAGEQLEIWADRIGVPCVRGQSGADSSAVLFDAIQSAKAKNIDYVLCDSAGRLHNQDQLMEALSKNKRVMDKALSGAPHEVLLVLDANTGQNMLSQAEKFIDAVGVTGLILTKLDGTARGGAVVAVARKTKLPIRRLGLGESAQDLVAFDPEKFSNALLGTPDQKAQA